MWDQEKRERLEASAAALSEAIASRDISKIKAHASYAAEASWKAGLSGASTKALPEAARQGWTEAVALLAASGIDANQADGCRQGFGVGKPPLAEAIGREDWGMAEALIAVGARFEPLRDMAWAPAFVASRHGWERGIEALSWMKSRGYEAWSDDAKAKQAQSSYLFTGSCAANRMDAEGKRSWDNALFAGADFSQPGAKDCLWSHLYGSAHFGADADAALGAAWIDSEPARERDGVAATMLEWSLAGGAPELAKLAAARLSGAKSWEQAGGRSVEKAANEIDDETKGDEAAWAQRQMRKKQAMMAAWGQMGDAWNRWSVKMERAACQAWVSGQVGMLESMLECGIDPEAVMGHWAASGPVGRERQGAMRPRWDAGIVAIVEKLLEKQNQEAAKVAFDRYDPQPHWRKDDQGEAAWKRVLSLAESRVLAKGTGAGPKAASAGPRL